MNAPSCRVLLSGAPVHELEELSCVLTDAGFSAEAYCPRSFDVVIKSLQRDEVSAVVLLWSEGIREVLLELLSNYPWPVVVVDHLRRVDLAEEMFTLGVCQYLSRRELTLLPFFLRKIQEHGWQGPWNRLPPPEQGSTAIQIAENETRTQLSFAVLHDVANVLSGVEGKLQLLSRHIPAEAGHELTELSQSCHQAIELVRNSLTFVRSDGALSAGMADASVFEQICSLFRAMLPRTVHFEQVIALGDAAVRIMPSSVLQVVLNLLMNARDAVLEKHRCESTSPVPPRIELSAVVVQLGSDSTPKIELRIADNGTGMTPEVLARAFEPGFTTKPIGFGTGLGLYSVQQVLRACGGTMDVASEPERGTKFVLMLPATSSTAAGAKSMPAAAIAPHSGTLLLVEDDDLLISVLKETFQELGYQLLLARDSVAALKLLNECGSQVRLVVSDFAMPGSSGLDLRRHVHEHWPRTKFILCSGYGLSEQVNSAEPIHFVRKPYHLDELLAKVEEVLREDSE